MEIKRSIQLPCCLVVRIRGSHPRGPGSIPGTGKVFDVIIILMADSELYAESEKVLL